MKIVKLAILFLLLGATCAGNAWAEHRRHSHFSVMIGPAWGSPYYPPRPYYSPRLYPGYFPGYSPGFYPIYSPPVIIERPLPQVYIEQPQVVVAPPAPPAPAAASVNYWYFCAASNAYYPYVNECRSGWQKIAPQPPVP